MDATAQSLESQLVLTAEQVEFFDRNGYLTLRGITTAKDLAELRDIYERMFRERTGFADGNYFDLVTSGEEVVELPQMTMMASYEPRLRETLLWQNVGAVSRQLLGGIARYVFDHGIRKPPNGPKTSWHQDYAYYSPGMRHRCLTFWVPLHDATIENGCMWFVPGSHRGKLLDHHPINGDPRVHGLEICDAAFTRNYPIDLRSATDSVVRCPIKAGDCTIHHPMTIHGTGPNLTSEPRLGYGLAFGVPTRRSLVKKPYPWNAIKQTLRDERHYKSLSAMRKAKLVAKSVLSRTGLY
jgi:ectoine hydroxylase-related dioxygenase (phytanoyl-CoA dioxygenase family)